MKTAVQLAAVLLFAAVNLALAAEKCLEPVIDVPLRDAAVCRGPDGSFYLTGTTALEGKDGVPDFHSNRGVHVWSSRDLESWTDLGFVWDLWEDPNPRTAGGSAWQTELYPVPGRPPGERARGMTAPRLAHDGERFWITFSMNGYAAGAMPGGADVSGPYTDTRLLAEAGGAPTGRGDASLFVDRDGTRYLVWGGGMMAPLKDPDTLEGLRHNEVGYQGSPVYLPSRIQGFYTDASLPEHGAPYGVSLVRDGDGYAFIYTATTLRSGRPSEDAYIVRSDGLFGPYGRPELLKAGAGRVTAFPDPEGELCLCYAPPARDGGRPVLEPMPDSVEAVAVPATPALAREVEIVASVPRRQPSEKPESPPQLLAMIEPVMDHPLRDAALCQGPDGTWYLTGTEAGRARDGTLDWSHNRGVRLWSSPDRESWTDLGYVWEIEGDGLPWQKAGHLDLTCGAGARIGRAVTAPEPHYLRGTFWIVYSMNGQGIGILKSKTGRAEGPYEDLGRLTRQGRDPSLFQDSDGTIYLAWGQGFYAELSDDLTRLVGPVKTLFTGVQWYPRYLRRPEIMGIWGTHLARQGEWYIWTFTTRTGRLGNNSIDTMASWSKSLEGPWHEPCLMLANGGQSTLVPDGEGGWLATVSGEDEYSQWPYRAAVTPVVSQGGRGGPALSLPAPNPRGHTTSFQAVNSLQATALDLWKGHPDLIPYHLRDVWVNRFDDGYYYCSGSFWSVDEWANQVPVYRSKDLLHWEPEPGAVMHIDEFRAHPDFDVKRYEEFIARNRSGRTELFDTKFKEMGDTVYGEVMILGMGAYLIRSTSGTIAGPYDPARAIPAPTDTIRDKDGSILFAHAGWTQRFPGLEAFEKGQTEEPRHPVVVERNLTWTEDVETGLLIVNGLYVKYSTDWSGSYDMNYMVSETIEGPWRNLRVGAPYGGNGYMFKAEDGDWWYAYFMNTNDYATRAQNYVRLNLYPLYVGWHGDELIIEPKAVRANRARLEKLGTLWQSPRR